jgi:hypothetical protein
MAIEQPVDEMQIAWSAASRANSKLARQMRFSTRGERRDLLVPDVDPFDLASATKGVRQAIETITDDTVDPLDAGCAETSIN